MFDVYLAQLPPQMQQTVVCAMEASHEYSVPLNAVLAVAEQEGGKPGMAKRNRNGSYDYGVMQINSTHLEEFGKYGITRAHLMHDGCYPVQLATWMIQQHLNSCNAEFWTCVARYHSKTPSLNAVYRAKILPKAAKWSNWIKQSFPNARVIRATERIM